MNADSRNVEGGVRWDNGSSQTGEQVDHWAKFIEAIGRAEKRKVSSMSRYHAQVTVQGYEEDSGRSLRQLPRKRAPSPGAVHYGVEVHEGIRSPGQRRNEYDDTRSYSPRHSQGKRHENMEHGYHNEEHEDRYGRGSYNERYKNPDLLKERSGENTGFS